MWMATTCTIGSSRYKESKTVRSRRLLNTGAARPSEIRSCGIRPARRSAGARAGARAVTDTNDLYTLDLIY